MTGDPLFAGLHRAALTDVGNECLHMDDSQTRMSETVFDVDSALGYARTLAVARRGLWYHAAPMARQTLKNDVHIECDRVVHVEGTDGDLKVVPTTIKDTPHLILDRIDRAENFAIYVLFPHLEIHGKQFRSLTHRQLSRWIDEIFHVLTTTSNNHDVSAVPSHIPDNRSKALLR